MAGVVAGSGAPTRVAGHLMPERAFDTACAMVVDYLAEIAPMGMWAVTRIVDGRQVLLTVRGDAYGIDAGAEFPYEDSLCRWMVSGEAPRIAPDVADVPRYAVAAAEAPVTINAYVGTPIVDPDGLLFGTVCGFDPHPLAPRDQPGQALLDLLSSLLAAVLQSDIAATAVTRELERARAEADRDVLTGLLNRRGWDRYLEREEERFRRFGDQATVVVLDLDRLKVVNDTLGHDAGDRHIRRAANALAGVVRSSDVLARLGGDEFGIIAVGATEEQGLRLVERASGALAAAGVEGSFGHAPYSVVAGFPGAVQAADRAMYEEKQARRANAARVRVGGAPRHRRPDGH
ncbi:diguanylate cyclase (GGDEF)-like protein [Pseudonocardia sediminis]|uniref:Diguanylate cyclase (GGDEF)-like protein n=1 Tax=Pseudonocardia sediminis TaxID=1397368 RepID=A0A4Q7V063_PSEST|nr:diguanylate cyclase [Pseudonocardia sediminis]RZT86681.1 diguanylate cyclase (GGDEF)-like protein [Pseudonocardia sediminis]